MSVDIGASIMHGCGDESQHVFQRAIAAKIRAPIVAGAGFYESTEHALWFDPADAALIPTEKVVEIHNIFFMASRYMASVSAASDDGAADMQTAFDSGVEYVCQHLGGRVLTPLENALLRKICARSVGYCSPMRHMALMQASAGMEHACFDAHIGLPYEEDDPPYPGEIPSMTPTAIRHQAARLNKAIVATQRVPKPMVASKRGGNGDRIVLDGYGPFLINTLAQGLDVRLGQSVCGISKVIKAPEDGKPLDVQDEVIEEGEVIDEVGVGWRRRSSVLDTRTVCVSTRTGEVYQGDFVVITLPLGVLKGDHEESGVTFSPPLSELKTEAIRGMGMGVHNKIVLRFREEDIFWPPKVPQLNCIDPRFQFLNLHSYGKTGLLLVHIFAESGFANGYGNLSDAAAVAEVLMVLGGMFCRPPAKTEANPGVAPMPGESVPPMTAYGEPRARVSALMHICENPQCSRAMPVPKPGSGPVQFLCNGCGHVMFRGEVANSEASTQDEKAARLRDRGPREPGVKFTGDLEGIQVTSGYGNLTWATLPGPEEYIVTRWDMDPYALGSYSYMPCGSSWQMIDDLAAPEPRESPHPYLFFAGEHCSDLGWQCVHGAHETGVRAAQEILKLRESLEGIPESNNVDVDNSRNLPRPPVANPTAGIALEDIPIPRHKGGRRRSANRKAPVASTPETFWTEERERALTRALVGYSDVYGNLTDVIDEIGYAIFSFRKEPTDMSREQVTELVRRRMEERQAAGDSDAKSFYSFHSAENTRGMGESFALPFQEVSNRKRLVGLNGSILKSKYSEFIINELKNHVNAVFEGHISYRETLRKIAVMIYKKDGGLMTKRCLSEYLRTQEFGNGPQKELFLEKYMPK